ncbi:hypothetical protein HZS_4522, partial [Henneguya salminicola]
MPQIITCDFELSLISAIKHEFLSSRLLCCYFYLKKAIERKLKIYKVSDPNCRIILSNIELLTVVPIEEIPTVLRYISTLTVLQPELTSFWKRTNNALERYNRRIGENFANAHPNLASFISIIRTEFLYYSERCAEIRQNSSGI